MAYQPKILLLDIETAPSLGYHWDNYETNILEVEQHWFILCYSYEWVHEKKIQVVALPDFKGYKKNKQDDYKLVESLWDLMDKADLIVAQNGDRFDIRKIKSRFLVHRMEPPKRFKTVDTLKILRSEFGFNSNKLHDICLQLGFKGKVPTTGKHLWLSCMAGDMKAWKLMKEYSARDIELLRFLYLLIRPYAKPAQHYNLNMLSGEFACSKCQGKRFRNKGQEAAGGRVFSRLMCLTCGAPNRDYGEKLPKVEIKPL